MAFMVFAGSFAVAATIIAVLFTKAKRKGEVPPRLAYFFALAAAIAWLNFFAAVIEAFG